MKKTMQVGQVLSGITGADGCGECGALNCAGHEDMVDSECPWSDLLVSTIEPTPIAWIWRIDGVS